MPYCIIIISTIFDTVDQVLIYLINVNIKSLIIRNQKLKLKLGVQFLLLT